MKRNYLAVALVLASLIFGLLFAPAVVDAKKPQVLPVGTIVTADEETLKEMADEEGREAEVSIIKVMLETVKKNGSVKAGHVTSGGGQVLIQRGARFDTAYVAAGGALIENFDEGAIEVFYAHVLNQINKRSSDRVRYYKDQFAMEMTDLERSTLLTELSDDIRRINDQIYMQPHKVDEEATKIAKAMLEGVPATATDRRLMYAQVRMQLKDQIKILTQEKSALKDARRELYRKDTPPTESHIHGEDTEREEDEEEVVRRDDGRPRLSDFPVGEGAASGSHRFALWRAAMDVYQKSENLTSSDVVAGLDAEIAYLEEKLSRLKGEPQDTSASADADTSASADADTSASADADTTHYVTHEDLEAALLAREEKILALTQEMVDGLGADLRDEITALDRAFNQKMDALQNSINELGNWLKENVGYKPPADPNPADPDGQEEAGNGFFGSFWFWALIAIILVVIIAIIATRKKGSDPTTPGNVS